jgi:hypothetical protein
MKSSKMMLGLASLGLCSMILVTGCKKKDDPKDPELTPVTAEENGQAGTDSREAQSENDAAINDVNDVMSNNARVSGKGVSVAEAQGVTGSICGLVIDSVLATTGVIKMHYDGTSCNNRMRTGDIKLTLLNYSSGTRWKDAGATIKVEYTNYKITRTSDQRWIMFNGTQNLINVSGGNWWNLIVLKDKSSLITTVTGNNLNVTWSDNKTAVYNINRKFTYTYPQQGSNNILTCQCEGIGTSGTLTNLENFGTTRDGDAFTSQVTTPLIWNLTCGPWAPIQGMLNIQVASKSFGLVFTYGVDASGNLMTVGPNQCPYGWKLTWTLNNNTNNKVFGYY